MKKNHVNWVGESPRITDDYWLAILDVFFSGIFPNIFLQKLPVQFGCVVDGDVSVTTSCNNTIGSGGLHVYKV